ncbi:YraN family protein [Oricola sp.]|uniref:YraN family protein n=1 Tax=Oricola sp. TaxID=1979950 RepID=UPI003BA9EB75
MNDAGKRKRRAAYGLGHRGELFAAFALRLKGFRIVARRYKTPAGEIDLIARRGDLVAIVEVKARPTLDEAMDAVTPYALHRIEAAADLWLSRQPDHDRLSMRFDMIAILPRRWPVHIASIYP